VDALLNLLRFTTVAVDFSRLAELGVLLLHPLDRPHLCRPGGEEC